MDCKSISSSSEISQFIFQVIYYFTQVQFEVLRVEDATHAQKVLSGVLVVFVRSLFLYYQIKAPNLTKYE